MKDKFLKLTNAAYKLLDFFPESDPLKNKAKEKVLAIMEGLVLVFESGEWLSFKDYFSTGREKSKIELVKDVDALLSYFEIGKSQGWLSPINCLIIRKEYEKIKTEIDLNPALIQALGARDKHTAPEQDEKKITQAVPEDNADFNEKPNELSARQKKILEYLINNEKAQVMDLNALLPDVTKRTIRRDLDELLKIGKIKRFGEFNQVFYRFEG